MAGVSGWKTRLVDDTDVPTPAAGKVHLFFDLADGQPKYKDETGAVNTFPSRSSFNGRTGAVVPIQADYDSFFRPLLRRRAHHRARGGGRSPRSVPDCGGGQRRLSAARCRSDIDRGAGHYVLWPQPAYPCSRRQPRGRGRFVLSDAC